MGSTPIVGSTGQNLMVNIMSFENSSSPMTGNEAVQSWIAMIVVANIFAVFFMPYVLGPGYDYAWHHFVNMTEYFGFPMPDYGWNLYLSLKYPTVGDLVWDLTKYATIAIIYVAICFLPWYGKIIDDIWFPAYVPILGQIFVIYFMLIIGPGLVLAILAVIVWLVSFIIRLFN